ncbi:amino acid ABC transporter permease [Bradyrhizobium zhanjiangense]|uniref:amino acid ABC transporter permease n=1 Tax=Bradyrhizobium zhanjiangense TaxID=1325107 RepID=UPI0013E8B796|nr:amino acid ABC transporter permease [Bradyrhizobium zhanjiangense]
MPLHSGSDAVHRDSAPNNLNAKAPLRLAEIVLAVAMLVAIALFFASLSASPNFQWGVFARYVTADLVLSGIRVTLTLTVIASVLGLAVGLLLAAMSTSSLRPLRWMAGTYIWCSRGTPVLMHLLLWFNLALFFPVVSIGIPFVYSAWQIPTNQLITSFTASILGLGLSEAAYMAEIVRGGLNAVDHGQVEAGRALGLRRSQILIFVQLPQTMRAIIPPISNQIILMLKTTSLVSVIAGNDLLTRVKDIYNDNFQVIPLLLVATFWYLAFASVATIFQHYLEARFSRDLVGRRVRKTLMTSEVAL